MVENIVFAFLVIVATGAGVWVWWNEVHGAPVEPKNIKETGEENT